MMKYTPRLTAPSRSDKNFIHYSKGGYNTCIMIDKNSGSVLPNCVGYAQGRLLEILGAKAPNWKLPACNAEDWLETAQKNGFKTGMTPKLGAVAVWKAGKTHNTSDGAGHVAVVEQIKANGDIVVSQSAWGGTEFYLSTITKTSGYIYNNSRPFLGFIYCGIEFGSDTASSSATTTISKPQPQLKSIDEVAREVIRGKWGNGADRKNRLTQAGYDYSVVQARVNQMLK